MHPERQKPWPKWHRAEFLGSLNPNLSSEQLTGYLKYLPQIPAVQSQLLPLGFLHSYCTAIFRPSTMGVSNVAWLWGANPYVEITVKIVKITWQSKPMPIPCPEMANIFCGGLVDWPLRKMEPGRRWKKQRDTSMCTNWAQCDGTCLCCSEGEQREKPLDGDAPKIIIQDWNQLIRRTQ